MAYNGVFTTEIKIVFEDNKNDDDTRWTIQRIVGYKLSGPEVLGFWRSYYNENLKNRENCEKNKSMIIKIKEW